MTNPLGKSVGRFAALGLASLLCLLTFLPSTPTSHVSHVGAQTIVRGNSAGSALPTHCVVAEHHLFWLTSGTPGLYECTGVDTWTLRVASGGGAQVVQTAIVDIGPHSNTGPGDQTKGVLNWSASPIEILLAPGANKFYRILDFSIQTKIGASGYVDPGGAQAPSLFSNACAYGDLFHVYAGSIVNQLIVNAANAIFTKDDLFPPQGGAPASLVLIYTPSNTQAFFNNSPLWFGDANGPGYQGNPASELTTGDGSVRIIVKYSIDDILP